MKYGKLLFLFESNYRMLIHQTNAVNWHVIFIFWRWNKLAILFPKWFLLLRLLILLFATLCFCNGFMGRWAIFSSKKPCISIFIVFWVYSFCNIFIFAFVITVCKMHEMVFVPSCAILSQIFFPAYCTWIFCCIDQFLTVLFRAIATFLVAYNGWSRRLLA